MGKPPKKKNKKVNNLTLIFDETKRNEYLTGFRKRKEARRQKAKEMAAQELKEERKEIKAKFKKKTLQELGKQEALTQPVVVSKEAKETATHSITVEHLDLSDMYLGRNIQETEEIQDKKASVKHKDEMKLLRRALKMRPGKHAASVEKTRRSKKRTLSKKQKARIKQRNR